jgi:translocation and assembly module TamB
VFSWIRRLAAGLLLLLLITIVAVLIFTRTPAFNSLVLAKITPYLATTFRGSIRIGAIEGSIWSELVLRDVTLHYRGNEVLRVPHATLSASLMPLLWRSVHLNVTIERPIADLVRNSDGNWNLLEALTEQHPSPTTAPSRWSVVLNQIAIRDGAIEVRPAPGRTFYRLVSLATTLRVDLGTATRVKVNSLNTTVAALTLPPIQIDSQLAFEQSPEAVDLTLSQLRLISGNSSIELSGTLTREQLSHLDFTIAIAKLAAADVNRAYPQLQLKRDLNGNMRAAGPLDAIKLQLRLIAGAATLDGDGQFNLATNSPKFSAVLKLNHANPDALINQSSLAGLFNASISVRGDGLSLTQASAQATITGDDLIANGKPLGKLVLSADSSGAELHINGNLAGPAGKLTLDGSINLAGSKRYQLKLVSERLDLARLPFAGMVATNFNSTATIDGNGLNLNSIDARLTATVDNSVIAGAPVPHGKLDVRLASGQAQISRASFEVAGASLDLHGVAALQPDRNSQLTYEVSSRNVAQLLKLAGTSGNGSFDLKGALSGPAARLRTSGTMSLRTLQTGDYRLQTAALHYDLVASGSASVAGAVSAQMDDLRAGVNMRRLSLKMQTAKAPPGPLSLTLDAQDANGARDHLALDLSYRQSQISGLLHQITLGLPDGVWHLNAPVAFVASRQSFTLGRFEMQNGSRSLEMSGTLGLAGNQNFSLVLDHFDLATLGTLTQSPTQLGGSASAKVIIAGSAAIPIIESNLSVTKITANKQRVGDFSAALVYRDKRASLNAALREDRANAITASGGIPAHLSWNQGVQLRETGPMDLRITSPHLDLARLAILAPRDVRDFRGVAALDLQLSGSLSQPLLTGNLRAAGIKGEIVPLGVTISEAHGRIDFTPDQLRITNFAAAAGNGSLSVFGALAIHDYSPGAVQLTIRFDHWPAIATHHYDAVLGGELELGGSFDAPRIAGNLEVLNGTIRPDLAFLTASSQLAPDDTIQVIEPGQAAPAPYSTPPSAPPPSRFNNLAMNVTVRIHRNTWIRHEQANAELEGRLQITKQPQEPVRIVGEIHTVRGWIIYDQRRFDLQSGTITFRGGEKIDPALDIDARYTLPDYLIDIVVSGTANAPALQLKSQPPLAQADILSLILFGKTTSALGQGQQQTLQERAMQMAGGYAAGQVGQAVAQSLGLQDLGIQLSGVSTTGGALGFGRYIGENTYVSASEDLGGTQGRKVSLQYFILRWLSMISSTSSKGGSEIDLNLTKQY